MLACRCRIDGVCDYKTASNIADKTATEIYRRMGLDPEVVVSVDDVVELLMENGYPVCLTSSLLCMCMWLVFIACCSVFRFSIHLWQQRDGRYKLEQIFKLQSPESRHQLDEVVNSHRTLVSRFPLLHSHNVFFSFACTAQLGDRISFEDLSAACWYVR